MNSFLLVLLLLVPAGGAIIGAFVPAKSAKLWALLVSLVTALVALLMVFQFNFHQNLTGDLHNQVQQSYQMVWGTGDDNAFGVPSIGFKFALGADTISLWLVLLTVFLSPLAIAASFDSIKVRQKEYYAWMLVLLTAMLGVFVARDLLLFYIFFELTLIPMFFIIGIWGGPEKRFAAGKFFLFTFSGSVFTLAVTIYLGLQYHTFDIPTLIEGAQRGVTVNGIFHDALSSTERFWVLLGLLAGFSVKVPLFPVHTWLPLAHTEAPTAGSVILAGVLLKLGTYGLLRLAMPIGMLSADGVAFGGVLRFIGVLCIIGVLYGALVAWVQQDIKKLVAYSSVSHLGFCVLGLVAFNTHGTQGSVLYMINHGLSTGALFLVIGMIYDRYHTRDINQLSGLAKTMPIMAFFFVLFALSSIGLPGLNGFVSEFLTILGAFTSPHLGIGYGVFAALGIILGAVYMLHMVARVIWGPLKIPAVEHGHEGEHGHDEKGKTDINAREIGILIPLAIAVVLLGVVPNSVLTSILKPVNLMLSPVTEAQIAKDTRPAPQPLALAEDR
ncbi:MAG TPA: NADH-quinone oxidoreductase subunit M [Tepidisphaeraceae bacterium]|jgi:NADH-quinone oxidoreductase subunit M